MTTIEPPVTRDRGHWFAWGAVLMLAVVVRVAWGLAVPVVPVSDCVAYDVLAGVYDWLTPDDLLTPEGNVAAFSGICDSLTPGARVLDCAAGCGWVDDEIGYDCL